MSDAISCYHDLLASGGTLAADSQAALVNAQQLRGLHFGERPVCTVLRPRFLTPAQYRLLHDTVKVMLPAFQAVYDRALADAAFRQQFRLLDWEEELLAVDPGFPDPSPTSRFDTFFASDDELLFTEFNTETPAGAGYSDALAELFYGVPVFQEFQRRFRVGPLPAKPGVLHALTDSFKQWQGHASDAAADRHPRLARGADVQRVRPLLRLLQGDGHRGPHRRPARGRVPRRQAHGRRLPHHAHLQAGADQRADRARRPRPPGRAGGARPRGVHGELVPVQDPVQEGVAGGAVRRAERGDVHRRSRSRPSRSTSRGRG